MKSLKFNNIKNVCKDIKPGEVVVIDQDQRPDRPMRCYLCYGTYYSLAEKYLKYECLVKRMAIEKGTSIESIVEDVKKNPDNMVPKWFYVRAMYARYPSLGYHTDHTVQFMAFDKCIEEYDKARNHMDVSLSFISALARGIDAGDEFPVTTDTFMKMDIDEFMKSDHTFMFETADEFGYNKKDLNAAVVSVEQTKTEEKYVSMDEDPKYAKLKIAYKKHMEKIEPSKLIKAISLMEELIALDCTKDENGLLYRDAIIIINEILKEKSM